MQDPKLERKLNDELSKCYECGKFFYQERDIQLCDNCVNKFDLNRLWALHDKGKLDALDFNENKKLREQFRIPKIKQTIITSGALAVDIVKDDPDDDKFIAAAIEGRASHIISGDRHLLNIGSYEGIKIMKARNFIGEVLKKDTK